jgi:hypothetical protein
MGMAIAGERKSVEGCSEFGKPQTGSTMMNRGNTSFSNKNVSAINENIHLRKGKNIDCQKSDKNSHVGMEVKAQHLIQYGF